MTAFTAFMVTIPGIPQQQGSKRVFNGHSTEANKNLAPWRADAIHLLRSEMQRTEMPQLVGPVMVSAWFVYPRPKAHFRTGRHSGELKDSAPLWKPSAPDLDKLMRAVGDALTQAGVVRDDALIANWSATKQWGPDVGVTVRVDSLDQAG